MCRGQLPCKVSYSQLKCTLFLDSTLISTRRKILTKSVEPELKVKGTGSRCVLEECFKDNYYARFYTPSHHCAEVNITPALGEITTACKVGQANWVI